MATFKGKDGTILIGSDVLGELSSFTLETSVNTTDDTVMGDDWESHAILQKKWSGSAECFWDDTNTAQGNLEEGDSVTLNMQPEGNTAGDFLYTGTATVESVSVSADKGGMVTASFNFKGNGALTRSTVSA